MSSGAMSVPVFDGGTDDAVAHFQRTGWLLTDTLDAATVRSRCGRGSTRSRRWPDGGGDWLHHREMTDDGPKLCRSENLVPFHDGLRGLLTTGPMLDRASALLGEPAVLYKEKINYKLPGGAGYAPAPGRAGLPLRRDPRVVHGRGRRRRPPTTAASRSCPAATTELLPDRRHRLHPRRTSRLARLGAGRGAAPARRCGSTRRTPHRSGPNRSSASPAGALPHLQRARRGRPPGELLPPEAGRVRGRRRADDGCRCRSSATSRAGRSRDRRLDRRGPRALRALGRRPLRRGAEPARPRAADGRARRRRRAPPTRSWPPRCSTTSVTCSTCSERLRASPAWTSRHEATGARYLAALFGPAVTGPIALHVRAKRYRCAVDPPYTTTSRRARPQPRASGRPDAGGRDRRLRADAPLP